MEHAFPGADMADKKNEKPAPRSDSGVERRGFLRLGTSVTALTGASAISALGVGAATAAPGDKNPPTSYVPTAEKGAPLGVATLDIDKKVPPGLLPDLSAIYARAGRLDARDFAAPGSGISAAAILAAIEAANGRPVYLHGTIDVGAGLVYAGTKAVNLVGNPGQTIISGSSDAATLIRCTGASPEPVNIRGLAVKQGGTEASASTLCRSCVRIENRTGMVTISENEFSGWVNAEGVKIIGGAGISICNNRFFNGFDTNPTKSSVGAIHVTGVVTGAEVKNNIMTGPPTNPWPIGIFFVGFERFAYATSQLTVTGNRISGLSRHAIGITHEDSPAVFNSGELIVSENIVSACREQGIKVKVAKRVHITDNFVTGCNTLPELSGELDGGINIQSSSESVICGNTVINDGTDGIRWDCKQTGAIAADESNLGRGNHTLSGNTVLNAANYGIRVGQGVTDLAVTGNTVVGGSNGIGVLPGTTDASLRIRRIAVTGNVVRGTSGSGIVAQGDDINITANIVTNTGTYGICVDAGNGFTIVGNTVSDAGQSGANRFGIRIGATASRNLVSGNTSGNRATNGQTHGLSLGAPAVVGVNNFDGNAIGRIHTPSNVLHAFNDAAPIAKPAVTGSKADGTALNNLLKQLAALGIIIDGTG